MLVLIFLGVGIVSGILFSFIEHGFKVSLLGYTIGLIYLYKMMVTSNSYDAIGYYYFLLM